MKCSFSSKCHRVGRYDCGGMCQAHFRLKGRLDAARGGYRQTYVDAAPVAAHIEAIRASGLGWKVISELSGVTVWALRGIGSQKFVHDRTAKRVLGVCPEVLADGLPCTVVDGVGSARRVQGLVAMGFSYAAIADESGVGVSTLGTCARGRRVTVGVARRIADAFDRMQVLPPPVGGCALRNRRYAVKRGWVPPFAWDEDSIDVPGAVPVLGVVGRDDWFGTLQELRGLGLSDREAAVRLGLKWDTLHTRLRRRELAA